MRAIDEFTSEYKFFNLLLVILMVTQMRVIGCNSSSVESNESAVGTTEDADLPAKISYGGGHWVECVLQSALFEVSAQDIDISLHDATLVGDSILLCYSYINSEEVRVVRKLDLHTSLLGVTLYNELGIAVAGHQYDLIDDSTATYSFWSGSDQVEFRVETYVDSLRMTVSDGTRSDSVAGREQNWGADCGDSLEVLLDDYATFATDDEDLITAEYLVADEDVLKYLYTEFGDDIVDSSRRTKLCAIAQLICTACTWLWVPCPPCWLVCVPACGLALACAIADLFS